MEWKELIDELEEMGTNLSVTLGKRSPEIRSDLDEFLFTHDCYLAFGASRAVLIPESENWVVKVDLTCNENHYWNGGISFCGREAEFYRAAATEGCDTFLAPVLGSGFFGCNLGWIAQEKVRVDWESESSVEDAAMEFASTFSGISQDDYEDPDEWAEAVREEANFLSGPDAILSVTGDTELARLAEEFELNDCHSENWGWLDERLVLFDFAGWR